MYYQITPSTATLDPTNFVSLATIRAWLRVGKDEDIFLTELMTAAMQQVEDICDQPIFQREYTVSLSGFASGSFPVLTMPTEPGLAATYIRDGSVVTLTDTDVVLIKNSVRYAPTLLGMSGVSNVTLTVKLGYAPENLPKNITMAVCYITSQLYENRNDGPDSFRKTSERLLTKYIRYGS